VDDETQSAKELYTTVNEESSKALDLIEKGSLPPSDMRDQTLIKGVQEGSSAV